MRRRPCNKIHHWSQAQQMIPLIMCEISFGKDVSKLVFGVDVLKLDLWVQVNSIEQPIKSNFVGSGNMSHCGTPSFNDHLDHCFVVFKHIQQSFLMLKVDVWREHNQCYSARWSSLEIFDFCQW